MAAGLRLICRSAELEEAGLGVRFTLGPEVQPSPAFVIRYDGQVFAYRNACGHVPVELDWLPGQFFDDSRLYLICSVHGALYAPDTGRCLGGRCRGQGLMPVPVREIDGHVYLEVENDDGIPAVA